MTQSGVEEGLRTDHIRDDEILWSADRAVDVRLSGEVHDYIVPRQGGIECHAVADVPLDECVAWIRCDRCEIGEIARVGELVEHGHAGDIADC